MKSPKTPFSPCSVLNNLLTATELTNIVDPASLWYLFQLAGVKMLPGEQ